MKHQLIELHQESETLVLNITWVIKTLSTEMNLSLKKTNQTKQIKPINFVHLFDYEQTLAGLVAQTSALYIASEWKLWLQNQRANGENND